MLESLSSTFSKTVHVVNLDAKQLVKVGRCTDVDIRITDITVSRVHSSLRLISGGKVVLMDDFSKFGTHNLVRKPMMIDPITH